MQIVLNTKAVNEVCLSSKEIDNVLMALGNDVASNYKNKSNGNVTVTLKTNLGDRHRVWINADYKDASKDNALNKSVKQK